MTALTSAPFGRVHIVGTGLVGASIGLALSERGVEVTLEDQSPTALTLASDYGAGVERTEDHEQPELVVVAVPPDVVAGVVVAALERFPQATVIDVASVKEGIFGVVAAKTADATRYVGTHPMAGRERGGALSARSDLFTARPWVICANGSTRADLVEAWVRSLDAVPISLSVTEHDRAVALISHAPQIVSSLMAARLQGASEEALSLAGGGLRDVTRIASSDPALWMQIVRQNAPAISEYLRLLQQDVNDVVSAVSDVDSPESRKALAALLQAGNEGVARLPGKHGVSAQFASLIVVVEDRPGELARLLTQLGEWNVNLEDLRLEHSPGANVGFADVTIKKDLRVDVEQKLVDAGWRIAGETG
jgi:prephenate dehydrogenase